MCKACQTPPVRRYLAGNGWQSTRLRVEVLCDIRRACREGQKDVPSWLAPKRSMAAELTYQLKRLAGNAGHEAETEYETV